MSLSICTPIKNRSLVKTETHELKLFPNCVERACNSLNALDINFEWVITDFGSDDSPPINWIGNLCHNYQVIQIDGKFNRGKGLNKAAESAKFEYLCFLDTDMLTTPDFWQNGIVCLARNQAQFPICWAYKSPEHIDGFWHNSAFGNCFVTKTMHRLVNGMEEKQSWGHEDVNFYQKVRHLFKVDRKICNGLIHQWHPDSFEWKNQYY